MTKLHLSDLKKIKETIIITETQSEKVVIIDKIKPNIDKLGRSYGTGKRKNAIARIWVKRGKGVITINGKNIAQYFVRPALESLIREPLIVANLNDQMDVTCTVKGGGHSGQAGSIRHGVAKALVEFDPELRSLFKSKHLLTRDSRVVERKKPGQPKARKKTQFSKR
jgi:small subunit ribosomal protein S9